ncbi:hypothetical protein HDK77DRAFT_238756 [Phyllosticta capitalensis]
MSRQSPLLSSFLLAKDFASFDGSGSTIKRSLWHAHLGVLEKHADANATSVRKYPCPSLRIHVKDQLLESSHRCRPSRGKYWSRPEGMEPQHHALSSPYSLTAKTSQHGPWAFFSPKSRSHRQAPSWQQHRHLRVVLLPARPKYMHSKTMTLFAHPSSFQKPRG